MLQEKRKSRIGIRSVLNNTENRAVSLFEPLLEKVSGLSKLRKIYEEDIHGCEKGEFLTKALDALHLNFDFDEEQLANIPTKGPVIVVANHPYGIHDSLLMAALLQRVRGENYRMMANSFFSAIEEMQDKLILVNSFGKNNSQNSLPLRTSAKWLNAGGILGVFPSGTVSHVDLKKRRVTDPAWSETVAGLVKMSGATVVPVHFSGHNSILFNIAGLIHPMFRTALLPRESLKEKKRIDVRIGKAISGVYLSKLNNRQHITDHIRMRCYLLRDKKQAQACLGERSVGEDTIISPIDKELLVSEIESLERKNHLLEYKHFSIYYATAVQVPNTLREIGRLREVTFRAAGEGTGHEIDLDHYDEHYLHLFVWDNDKKQILGAYRMGEVASLLKEGKDELYTAEFYKYTNNFLQQYNPALEMGRSFVCKEYQKKPYSLLLLWRGICTYVARNPHYRYLFGAVSVSNEYCPKSRALMANLLTEKECPLKSRMPVKIRLSKEVKNYCRKYKVDKPEDISILVKSLETDGKDVPVLVKQYMKLGGKFLVAFI